MRSAAYGVLSFPETADMVPISEEHGFYLVEDAATLSALKRQGLVDFAEKDLEVILFDDEIVSPPQATDFSRDCWYLTASAITMADSLRCDGRGVRIGVIDSGVSFHDALNGCVEPGYDFLSDSEDYSDKIGHGTFVAGMIAARTVSGEIGCATGAKIVPIKCFDRGRSTYASTLCTAIYAAVDTYDCDVINMSFGITSDSAAFHEAIAYAYSQGVVLVAAVGNDGGATLQYPAAYDEVLGVGAIDRDGKHSSFSQINFSVDLVAPGQDLWGLTNSNGYTKKSGTSFAAPQVSAAAARMINALTDPTPAEVMDYLKAGAVDLGAEGRDIYYGEGKLSVDNAINLFLAECPVFLSPGETNGEDTTFLLKTTTGHAIEADVVLISFDGSLYEEVHIYEVSLGENETFMLHTFLIPPDVRVKCTVWDSFTLITPLTRFRYFGR